MSLQLIQEVTEGKPWENMIFHGFSLDDSMSSYQNLTSTAVYTLSMINIQVLDASKSFA